MFNNTASGVHTLESSKGLPVESDTGTETFSDARVQQLCHGYEEDDPGLETETK